ncbi:MAG TPA: M14 family metallopeptidase [Burkholderiaceae bacterium]|nr:M14 family metallopeptidase [Burkholderiaceae bacterium]
MIRPDPHFPSSYAQARERFLAAARARGARLHEHAHPLRGLDGEALAADVAVLGPDDAASVVLLHSGTHGVEGYCGSGIQHALLADGGEIDDALAAGARVVLLHAINPWGFSWRRRTTEDNVDLNRNFRTFSGPADDPAYDEVHPLLLPERWPWTAENAAAIGACVARRGLAWWQWAVSHGQRSRPDGLFHAGNAPTWSNATMREVLRRHARGAERLYWIDVHTGLGPAGHGELIYAGLDAPDDVARTRAVWGERVTSIYEGSSASARIEGQIGGAAYDECPGTALAAIAIEFGTLPLEAMIDALRVDHWVAARAPGDEALRATARERMTAAFFVDADDWKAAVLAQGRDAFAKAVAALPR